MIRDEGDHGAGLVTLNSTHTSAQRATTQAGEVKTDEFKFALGREEKKINKHSTSTLRAFPSTEINKI